MAARREDGLDGGPRGPVEAPVDVRVLQEPAGGDAAAELVGLEEEVVDAVPLAGPRRARRRRGARAKRGSRSSRSVTAVLPTPLGPESTSRRPRGAVSPDVIRSSGPAPAGARRRPSGPHERVIPASGDFADRVRLAVQLLHQEVEPRPTSAPRRRAARGRGQVGARRASSSATSQRSANRRLAGHRPRRARPRSPEQRRAGRGGGRGTPGTSPARASTSPSVAPIRSRSRRTSSARRAPSLRRLASRASSARSRAARRPPRAGRPRRPRSPRRGPRAPGGVRDLRRGEARRPRARAARRAEAAAKVSPSTPRPTPAGGDVPQGHGHVPAPTTRPQPLLDQPFGRGSGPCARTVVLRKRWFTDRASASRRPSGRSTAPTRSRSWRRAGCHVGRPHPGPALRAGVA